MILPAAITSLLAAQCGHSLTVPAHCEVLALDIESRTGQHIGLNTVKRLLGFIGDHRTPRASTLNIIANYLGYDVWESLCLHVGEISNSAFGSDNDNDNELHAADLTEGDEIEITYLPDRRLVIVFKGGNTFDVVSSENSKLRVGDTLRLTHLVRGYPLLVSDVTRSGESLGAFTAGKQKGIDFKLL